MASTDVFAKLQLRDAAAMIVLDAPASFELALRGLQGVAVHRSLRAPTVSFALAFVTTQAKVDQYARGLAAKAPGDAAIWFAYPKGSSKRYRCEFTRDTGWATLGQLGFEPVRLIAVDEDWSALRFRRTEFIKTMKRAAQHALSRSGKAKAGRKN